jgi:TRAP-type C4-dicarboxylate transport system permease small subunit
VNDPRHDGVVVRKLLNRLYDGAAYLAALCIVLIFIAMVLSSAARIAGVALAGVDDVVSWLTAAAAFLAMAHAFRNGDFVRMTLVIESAPLTVRRVMEPVAIAAGLVGSAYAAYWIVVSVYESWKYQEMTTGLLVMPLWIPQIPFAIGAALLFIAFFDEFVAVLRGARPSYLVAVEERHARGDFSEEL